MPPLFVRANKRKEMPLCRLLQLLKMFFFFFFDGTALKDVKLAFVAGSFHRYRFFTFWKVTQLEPL